MKRFSVIEKALQRELQKIATPIPMGMGAQGMGGDSMGMGRGGMGRGGMGMNASPFKNGGIVKKKTLAIIGEEGKEAVIPLTKKKRARIIAKRILRETKE